MFLLQQLGQDGIWGTVIWFGMFFVLMFVYPKLMLKQMLMKLEKSALKLENLSKKGKKVVAKKITKNPSKKLIGEVDRFSEFFVVEPSNIDPQGLVYRTDQIIRNMEHRFERFVDSVSKKGQEEKQKINYGMRAAISVHMFAKIVRHNVEMVKKLNNLQLALMLQMQMPLIEKLAKSQYKGVESFVDGKPVGDSIGPLVAADLMGDAKTKEIAEDVIYAKKKIEGVNCHIIRADGPGPRLGRVDEALKKLSKNRKFKKIITIDAKGKLEGEKTGSVVEGVGFAMGGPNPQREMIENFVLEKKIPLDVIGVNVGFDEAIVPMPKGVIESIPEVKRAISRSLEDAKSPVLIAGIGNSSGVPKGSKKLKKVKKQAMKTAKKIEKEKEKKKQRPWYKKLF